MPILAHTALQADRLFPGNYQTAQEHWRARLARTGELCRQRWTFPAGGVTPQRTVPATDCAWLGPADAGRVLVLISGTHGIEGFTGSAVLFDLLGRLPACLPDGVALLCIHALNPWGYAWYRRCDAEGIDLNRNFIDFSRPLPDNPGYRELRDALFDEDAARRSVVLERYLERHCRTAYDIAISGGQYCDPLGPFYGGTAPAHGRRAVESLIRDCRLGDRQLGVIDVHTGLGPYGHGEIICDHAPDSTGTGTARAWYGDECTLPALGTSSSVPKLGLLDYAWHALMEEAGCFVTLEFGTYPTDDVFGVLLEDHRFRARHGRQPAEHPGFPALVAELRERFCPDDEDWREQVVLRAREVIDRALEGLLV